MGKIEKICTNTRIFCGLVLVLMLISGCASRFNDEYSATIRKYCNYDTVCVKRVARAYKVWEEHKYKTEKYERFVRRKHALLQRHDIL